MLIAGDYYSKSDSASTLYIEDSLARVKLSINGSYNRNICFNINTKIGSNRILLFYIADRVVTIVTPIYAYGYRRIGSNS